MSGNRESARKQSARIAFCGMQVALSVVLMLSGGLIPIMTYVSPLASGLLLLPILAEYGRKYAWTAWLATALIVLMLGADKEAAFFYAFLGYYPILKWELDRRLRKRPVRLICKSALFLLAGTAMYGVMALMFGAEAILGEFAEMGVLMTVVFMLMLTLCMLMYDYLLLPLLVIYDKKLRPRLKKLGR